ncbi:hypothetical protein ISS37_05565 [candidate division KSB1 bacterium]|nr:hypothetical protein [candidate division KSB1 bacterium]
MKQQNRIFFSPVPPWERSLFPDSSPATLAVPTGEAGRQPFCSSATF